MKTKKQAILCIISAAFFFALMNLFVKLAGDLPIWQKCFFRNLVAFFIAVGIVFKDKVSIKVEKEHRLFLLGRCVSGSIGIICNFYAIGKLNIADASMLNKLSPFFAIIFSIFILKEKPKRMEWITVCIAFCGALFIIKPSFGMDSFPAFIGFISGIGAGLAYTCVRRLGSHGVKGPLIVFYFSLFSCLIVLPGMMVTYESMSVLQLVYLIGAGCAAAVAQFSITAAYSKAPAKEISVFDYMQVIFAAILSFVVLHRLPDIYSVMGYIIIIGTAVYRWSHDMKQSKLGVENI